MMMRRTIALATLAATAFTTAATAVELPEGWSLPTAAHEGVRVTRAGGEAIETRFRYLPPGKQREEMSQEGMSITMIIRQDLGIVWTLLPGGNMYMEMDIDGVDAEGPAVPSTEGIKEFREVGKEQVNGWPTTRYRVVTLEDGKEAEGDFWVTEHWIPIRMEITMRDNPQETVTMEIRDLKVQAQDAALFELPPGATKMSGFRGMGGPQGEGFGGFGAELAEEATETARDTAKDETRDSVKDAVREGVRGLFRR
jgi:outer membrane lipoprotein-sorting protein